MPRKPRTIDPGDLPPERRAAQARDGALRALSRREHSAAELRHKLARRGHDDETAAAVVENLSAAGWQSDARYAEMLVRNRAAQGYGPLRITAELEHAGVTSAGIAEALQAADENWRDRAVALHQRKFRRQPTTAAEWQKQYRYLASHGFAPEHIRAALKRDLSEDA